MPRARMVLVTAAALALVPIAAWGIANSGPAKVARSLPASKPVIAISANAPAPTSRLLVPTTAAVVDLGPTTFPVTGQAAMGRFALVINSASGPAVKVAHPTGAWSGYQVAVMWMSHVALRLSLHPGVKTTYSTLWDPGFSRYWTTPTVLYPPRPYQLRLATTFNGGFRLLTGDSRGGYWDYGKAAGGHGVGPATGGRIVYDPLGHLSLVTGAESVVIYKDGTWKIGTWRRELNMTSQVAYVRQERAPLIDSGVINPLTKTSNCQAVWGVTLHGGCVQYRSAVGVTSAGDLVFASAVNVSAYQIALIMRQAGAIRAMQLDINPQWVASEYYTPRADGTAIPHVVFTHFYGIYHYITGSVAAGTAVNRDFFAAYLR